MNPIDFKERNTTLTGKEFKPLPAYKENYHYISCWRPSWLERISILLFGRVWLCMKAIDPPPVFLSGERSINSMNIVLELNKKKKEMVKKIIEQQAELARNKAHLKSLEIHKKVFKRKVDSIPDLLKGRDIYIRFY